MVPPLGRHYLDQWEDEDNGLAPAPQGSTASLDVPPLQRVRPEAITEDALGMENVYLGPLSERLVSAVAVQNKDAQDGPSADGDGKWAAETAEIVPEYPPPRTTVLDAVELEERVRRELRFVGLLAEDDVRSSPCS